MTEPDDLVAQFRHRFVIRLHEEHDALHELAATPDRAVIIERAHKLAGLAGMLGAPEVSDAAFAVEAAARSGADCDNELSALISAIASALEELSGP